MILSLGFPVESLQAMNVVQEFSTELIILNYAIWVLTNLLEITFSNLKGSLYDNPFRP